MKIRKFTLTIEDEDVNREFTNYLSNMAIKRMPIAIIGMLGYLILAIKGVYDCGYDSEMPFSKYTRLNFFNALFNSIFLILAYKFSSRIKDLIGIIAAIFIVFCNGQIVLAVHFHE